MIKVLGFTILCGGWDATLKFSKRYDVFVKKRFLTDKFIIANETLTLYEKFVYE